MRFILFPFRLLKAIFLDVITLGGLLTFRYYTYTWKLIRDETGLGWAIFLYEIGKREHERSLEEYHERLKELYPPT